MSGLTTPGSTLPGHESFATPRVSVILCAGCEPTQLARALASLRNQTCTDFEVFVIDPRECASAPGTAAEGIAADLAGVAVRPISWTNWAVSRNAAIRASRAPYLSFLDTSESWDPTFLERCLAFLTHHPECDVVATRSVLVMPHRDTQVVIPTQAPEGWILNRLFIDPCLSNSCTVFRRQVWERLGGLDERVPLRSLEHFWLRVAVANRFGAIPDPLVLRDWPSQPETPEEEARRAFNRAELLHRFYTEQGGDHRVDNQRARRILYDACCHAARWASRTGDLAYCARLYRGAVYYSPTFWNKIRFLMADRRRIRAGLPSLEESRFFPDDVA